MVMMTPVQKMKPATQAAMMMMTLDVIPASPSPPAVSVWAAVEEQIWTQVKMAREVHLAATLHLYMHPCLDIVLTLIKQLTICSSNALCFQTSGKGYCSCF